MVAEDEGQGGPKPADKRYDWLGERALSFLRGKEDAWTQLLAGESR